MSTLTHIDGTSELYYEKRWLAVGENKSKAVVPLRDIFATSFRLIMNNQDAIDDNEKIFIIRIARCYIT